MLARHAGASWYPSARATWDDWTERVLAATDGREVDAMMAEVLPLYTAHPEQPAVQRLIETWRRDARTNLAAIKVWENGLWQRIDVRPLLEKVRCPTLVLAAELGLNWSRRPASSPASAFGFALPVERGGGVRRKRRPVRAPR